MIILTLVLRLIHVVAGVFWVGSAILSTYFIAPAVSATAEAGQKFMGYLVSSARISVRMTAASIATVLAGAALYWIDAQGFASLWWRSGPGIGFGLGALAALLGMGFGHLVGRRGAAISRLSAQIQGKPSAEQASALGRAREEMNSASRISTAFLLVSLVLMATARYWFF